MHVTQEVPITDVVSDVLSAPMRSSLSQADRPLGLWCRLSNHAWGRSEAVMDGAAIGRSIEGNVSMTASLCDYAQSAVTLESRV